MLGLFAALAVFADPGPTAVPTTPLRDEYNRPIKRKKPAAKRSAVAKSLPPPRCPLDMAYIRGGRFGATSIRHFCLDITEVTVEKFLLYIKTRETAAVGGDAARQNGKDLELLKVSLVNVTGAPDDPRSTRCTWRSLDAQPLHPINCVSQRTAHEFCTAQGKRLPRDHEWHWAARGGKKGHTYPWGSGLPAARRLNLAAEAGAGRLTIVGKYPRSANGLQDMAGNLAEWVLCDEAKARCPVRGGHYQTSDFTEFRVTHVDTSHEPDERSELIGFRCAAEPHKRSKK
jgi:formylglycine-generating enzyme required for sulfatase activity